MTPAEMKAVVELIRLPAWWRVELGFDGTGPSRPWLRVVCPRGSCNVSGGPLSWSGRKWRLSFHMTRSEIVQTAFKAALTAAEHELREQFTYRGVTVFQPHLDLDRLVQFVARPINTSERTAHAPFSRPTDPEPESWPDGIGEQRYVDLPPP